MNETLYTLLINAVATPLLVLFTMWFRTSNDKERRLYKRDEKFFTELVSRVDTCERRHEDRDKEIREIRIELKNRDAEYLELYKEHTTLRARYDVLQADHIDLKKQHEITAADFAALKESIKSRATEAAQAIKNI